MVNQEIYVLTKHGRFQADYVENLPIYRRRYFLELFEEENQKIQEEYNKLNKNTSFKSRKAR